MKRQSTEPRKKSILRPKAPWKTMPYIGIRESDTIGRDCLLYWKSVCACVLHCGDKDIFFLFSETTFFVLVANARVSSVQKAACEDFPSEFKTYPVSNCRRWLYEFLVLAKKLSILFGL